MKLQIIIGSSRPGRVSDRVAKWVAKEAANLENTDTELVDLADYDMPLFNEAISPRYNPEYQPTATVQKWLSKLAQADAYAFVTPEYNHSIPAVLKNALDYVKHEFTHRPAAIVSHGGVGGARATEHLKNVLSEVGLIVIPKNVAFVGMLAMNPTIDEHGNADESITNNPHGPQAALKTSLQDLAWYASALKAAR